MLVSVTGALSSKQKTCKIKFPLDHTVSSTLQQTGNTFLNVKHKLKKDTKDLSDNIGLKLNVAPFVP